MRGSRVGRFFAIGEVFTEEEVRATRYFKEWMEPRGFAPLALMGSFTPSTRGRPGFGHAFYGSRDFTADEVAFCRVIDRHLTQAGQTAWALRTAQGTFNTALEILDAGLEGILFITREGLVSWKNRRAAELLENEPELRLERGRLRATGAAAGALLDESIASATALDELGYPAGRPSVVSLRLAGSRFPLGIGVVPIAEKIPNIGVDQPAAAVFLIDPNAVRRPPVGILEALYELTPGEAKLARTIAEGQSPAEFADATGRSLETVRTQLKFLFRKLGVRRQAELVSLLASTPVSLDDQ